MIVICHERTPWIRVLGVAVQHHGEDVDFDTFGKVAAATAAAAVVLLLVVALGDVRSLCAAHRTRQLLPSSTSAAADCAAKLKQNSTWRP